MDCDQKSAHSSPLKLLWIDFDEIDTTSNELTYANPDIFDQIQENSRTYQSFQNWCHYLLTDWYHQIEASEVAKKLEAYKVDDSTMIINNPRRLYASLLSENYKHSHFFLDLTVDVNANLKFIFSDKYDDSLVNGQPSTKNIKICLSDIDWMTKIGESCQVELNREFLDLKITPCPVPYCVDITAYTDGPDDEDWDERDAGDSYSKTVGLNADFTVGIPKKWIAKEPKG